MEKKKQTEGTVFISEADQYLFAQGTHYDIYKKLGAHPSVENIRQILLPTAQKCALGLHQKRLIFPAINGQTICGSGNVRKGTIIKSRWQFMNATSVPG